MILRPPRKEVAFEDRFGRVVVDICKENELCRIEACDNLFQRKRPQLGASFALEACGRQNDRYQSKGWWIMGARTHLRNQSIPLTVTLFLLFAITPPCWAQVVHALVVGDVSPSAGWGKYTPNVAMDITTMVGMLKDNMPENQIRVRRIEIEEDEQSDPAFLMQAIEACNVRPRDILWFYFSGHGGSDDQGHYLALAKGKLPRKKLLQALQSKGAKLTLLITDCCNTRSDGYVYISPAFRPRDVRSPTPLFRSLLLEQNGLVNINSSSPGESAFFTPHDPEMKNLPGSIFTKELIRWFDRNRQRSANWEELVRAVSLQTHESFHDFYPKGADAPEEHRTQLEQNVDPMEYPGKPEKKGPRTGMLVREFQGRGVIITQVDPQSPAAQVFSVSKNSLISLQPQQAILAINGEEITSASEAMKKFADAPQIVRLTVQDPLQGKFEVLMRMRY